MTIFAAQLVGLQRAEFEKASRLQSRIAHIQIVIAVFAVLAVLVTDPTLTYIGAGCAAALCVAWAWTSFQFKESRAQAERARRANVIINGFGEAISENEIRDLEARFTVAAQDAQTFTDEPYYATGEPPGPRRVAKILEESAFWSSHLLRHSANAALASFVAYLLAGGALLFISVPFVDMHELQLGARIFCAFVTLLVSAEVLGVALSYASAARIVENILPRLEALAALGFPRADLFMIFSDYNSAVESAPTFRRGIYARHRDRLNTLWSNRTKHR